MRTPITPAPQQSPGHVPAALVWLDRSHALVARAYPGGTLVTAIDRNFGDPEAAFLLDVVHEAAECDRLVVMGPDAARLAFEREYVALYHRPDRLVDAGVELEPEPRELADRLSYLRLTSDSAN
jgi:hypothetical protein